MPADDNVARVCGDALANARSVAGPNQVLVHTTLTVADGRGTSESVPVIAGGTDLGQLPYRDKLPARVSVAKLDAPLTVASVTLSLDAGAATDVYLNGLAAIDDQIGRSYSPLVTPGPEMSKVYQGDVKVYANGAALQPAFLVHNAKAVDGPEQAAAAIGGDFDPAGQVILEANPQPPPSRSLLGRIVARLRRMLPQQSFTLPQDWLQAQESAGQDRVTVDQFQPERIQVSTNSDAAGFLVLSQSYYPGWQATIDGEPAQLLAADALFQAVHLLPGQHRVEFTFKPRSVLIGELISLVSLAITVVGLALSWLRRARRRTA